MSYSIAIDGPAGAGKSTIAKKVAGVLEFIYIDTGAMYRAMAYYLISLGIDEHTKDKINDVCGQADISIVFEDGEQQVYLNNENVTDRLRTEQVGKMASVCAENSNVRERLVELQRKLAKSSNVVMDGRDIGSCVLPDSQLKIYLTADVVARARRRHRELTEKNISCNIKEIEKDIEERDFRDMNREISPLQRAKDSRLIDTTNMSIEEAADAVLRFYFISEQLS